MTDKTTRRGVLGSATAAAAASLSAPSLAQQAPRKLSMASSWPRNSPILPAAAERVARTITTLSGGSIEIEVSHSGERVDPFEVQDAVGNGDIDLYHSVEQYFIKTHPGFSFFSAVPFGLVPPEMAGWLKFAGGQELWNELSARFGVRAFMAGSPGAQMGGWFPKPIETTDDFDGIRFRIPGAAGRVYAAAGVDTVNLPGSQLVEALFSNEIQAVEWIGPFLDLDYGFVKLLPHYMYPGWHDPGSIRSVGINLDLWNGLSETEQAIVELAVDRENTLLQAELAKLNGDSVLSMKIEYGAETHKFPDDFLKKLYQFSDETLQEVSKFDELAARIAENYFAFRSSVAEYAAVSESAYLEARNSALSLNKVSKYDD